VSDIRMRVWRVGRRSDSRYLLILRDDWGSPLVMVIGPCEAAAIWSAMRENSARLSQDPEGPGAEGALARIPAAHDLIDAMLTRLGGKLEKVVIDDLWNGTYYAKLHLAVDGQRLTVDGRPSDCVALALRARAPLYVTEEVLDASREDDSPSGSEPESGDPLAGLEDL